MRTYVQTQLAADPLPEDFRTALIEAALRVDREYRYELREACISDRWVPRASDVIESVRTEPGFAALETIWRISDAHLLATLRTRTAVLEKASFEKENADRLAKALEDTAGALGA